MHLREAVTRTVAVDGGQYSELQVRNDRLTLTVQWYSGPAYVPSIRRLLRSRADVLVVVVDSQQERLEADEEVLAQIEAAVASPRKPIVLQFNKRDLPNAAPQSVLARLDRWNAPRFESTATERKGVWEPFETAVLIAARARGIEAAARELLGRR